MDTSEVDKVAAELMECLEADHPNATVGTVALVVELQEDITEEQYREAMGEDPEDDPSVTFIRFRCSDGRRWIQTALFDEASRASLENRDAVGE